MDKVKTGARKVGVLLLGVPVLIAGILLIPLPGPGLLVCIAGLVILATEFSWAQRYLDKARAAFRKVMDEAKKRQQKIRKDSADSDKK